MKKVFWLIMAGVAIGVLLAPDKGSETRKRLTDNLDDLKDKAKNKMDDLIDRGKDFAKKGKESAKDISKQW